jgi:hypothetical protein
MVVIGDRESRALALCSSNQPLHSRLKWEKTMISKVWKELDVWKCYTIYKS